MAIPKKDKKRKRVSKALYTAKITKPKRREAAIEAKQRPRAKPKHVFSAGTSRVYKQNERRLTQRQNVTAPGTKHRAVTNLDHAIDWVDRVLSEAAKRRGYVCSFHQDPNGTGYDPSCVWCNKYIRPADCNALGCVVPATF